MIGVDDDGTDGFEVISVTVACGQDVSVGVEVNGSVGVSAAVTDCATVSTGGVVDELIGVQVANGVALV